MSDAADPEVLNRAFHGARRFPGFDNAAAFLLDEPLRTCASHTNTPMCDFPACLKAIQAP